MKDGDQEFQHPLGPGILIVSYGESILRVHCIPELSANELISLGGKSLPSQVKSICFSPFLYALGFQARSDGLFVLIRGSYDKLPHHLLVLDRPGFAHQSYTSDPGKILFQVCLLPGFPWNGWYYEAECEWHSCSC